MSELRPKAPTFYAIIWVKLLKGALFLSLAFVAYALSDNDLPADFKSMVKWLRFNPERRFFHDLTLEIAKLTASNVLWVGAGSFFYSLFSLVEGIGMIYRAPWAGWLAIGESAFFIPIEIYELYQHPTFTVMGILAFNILIVIYLFRNRDRLFKHHH
jgi:uncharacterized membrane protein (DUF2068 family)